MDARTTPNLTAQVVANQRVALASRDRPLRQKRRLSSWRCRRAPYPACLPLPAPAGVGCRRSGLLSSTGSVSRRAPAGRGGATSVRAVDGASAAAAVAAAADAPLPPPQITWQIVVGAVAGVTPFVVAGVEFSKRIFAQKKCEVCGGSGLVMKNDYYVRCQGCGGFLPWQSWRRFFTG